MSTAAAREHFSATMRLLPEQFLHANQQQFVHKHQTTRAHASSLVGTVAVIVGGAGAAPGSTAAGAASRGAWRLATALARWRARATARPAS